MKDVQDKDLGWRDIVQAAGKADGLELRNGILDWRLKYRGGKGQEIAKVAAIHMAYSAIADGYEAEGSTIDSGMNTLLRKIHEGTPDVARLIYQLMGRQIRDAQRAALYRMLRKRSGDMGRAIRATVFEGGRVGARPAGAHKGKVAAGDNPTSLK